MKRQMTTALAFVALTLPIAATAFSEEDYLAWFKDN